MTVSPTISLVLPLPPSVNRIWAPVRTKGGARFVRRAEYADWSAMAKREVEAQRAGASIAGAFRLSLLLPEGRHDSDNMIKALLDACQAGGAIANDKHCRGGSWDLDDTRDGTALVEIYELPPVGARPAGSEGTARMEHEP
jgi:Holliday junction resolvase RusA-like endonuclease